MAEKFIVVWTIDGETMSMPHSTQDEALQQAETLLREHGCNLEITLVVASTSAAAMIFFAAAIEIGSPYGVVGGATCCWVIWVLAWEAAAQTAAVT
jgi:hypothetical protein